MQVPIAKQLKQITFKVLFSPTIYCCNHLIYFNNKVCITKKNLTYMLSLFLRLWHFIWDALSNLVPFDPKNTNGGVLLFRKLQSEAYNFTKSNTSPWKLFTFLELQKWYQIAQSISHSNSNKTSYHNQNLIHRKRNPGKI